jgi:hypothetical protein
MTRHALALSLFAFCTLADGRPLIIQESQWLPAPDIALSHFAESLAIDGDWAVATALRSADGSFEYPYQQLALLYRRVGDQWSFERILVDDDTDEASWNHPSVAMKSGLLSVSTSPLRTFTLRGDSWSETPRAFPAPTGAAEWANGITRIDGSTVAAATNRCFHGAGTADFAEGGWTVPRFVTGTERYCDLANDSNSLDISGNTLALTNPQEDSALPDSGLRLYSRTAAGQSWRLDQTLPVGEWGRGVAILGNDLIVGDADPLGNRVYRRGSSGWQPAGNLPTLMGFNRHYDGAYHIARGGDLVLFSAPLFDDLPGAIAVYRRGDDGGYQHVALLVARTGDWLGDAIDISGRTVVVGGYKPGSIGEGRLYFFELPERFPARAVVQDDFEDGDAADWQQQAGQFSVARRGANRVLQQPSLAGDAIAVLANSHTTTQSITVDIRPRQFDGEGRWAGVATRYRDPDNLYYVTLRHPGTLDFRRLRGGNITVLASRAMPVAVNGDYRVRLESAGSRHRVFVNGELQFAVTDAVFGSGSVALMTYRTAADFDNVMVTPGLQHSLVDAEILSGGECEHFVNELTVSGSPDWDCEVYERPYLRQASLTGIARGALGPATGDQVVEARVLAEQFAEGGTQDKWLGVMARYVDEDDYYYLILRSSNVVSLRKVVDGQIVELSRTEMSVTPGAWYSLRLEAVGDRLRGYVNDVLHVVATDDTHAQGNSGIVTYRTAARYDYLRVFQP